MKFEVGQRVVCIDGRTPTNSSTQSFFFGLLKRCSGAGTDLEEGRVYTVLDVCIGVSRLTLKEEPCLIVAEVRARHPGGCWPARLFRPLSERRLDQFRALLVPKPKQQVEADS